MQGKTGPGKAVEVIAPSPDFRDELKSYIGKR